jgi:hypothetical protein
METKVEVKLNQEAIEDYLTNHREHPKELKEQNIQAYKDLIEGKYQIKLKLTEGQRELLKNKVKVLCKDIMEHSDECLVNAANELLLGGGGVDGVIHKLGGEKLIEEVMKIPLNPQGARIIEGQAVKTEGYNDRYPKFIHTVAPYYDFDTNLPKPKVME